MNDFERRLSESLNAERAHNEARADADLPRIKGTVMDSIYSRKRFTMVAAIGAAAVVLAAGGIFVPRILGDTGPDPAPPAGDDQPSPDPTFTGPAVVDDEQVSTGDCAELPFQPTYLPEGFSYELQPGDGGQVGIPVEDQSPQAYGHWSGGEGTFISVYQKGAYYELPRGAEKIPMFDQGFATTGGRFGVVEDGFALEFKADDCDYSAIGFGVSEEDMRTFADGLIQTRGELVDGEAFAMYPDLTAAATAASCVDAPAWRRDPAEMVKHFAEERLLIDIPIATEDGRGDGFVTFTVGEMDWVIATVTARELGYGCWSVMNVGPAEKGGPSLHSFGFNGPDLDLGLRNVDESVDVLVNVEFFGDPPVEQHLGPDDLNADDDASIDLGYDPSTPGAFLILFLNGAGEPLSAYGMPLPAYDTAAG